MNIPLRNVSVYLLIATGSLLAACADDKQAKETEIEQPVSVQVAEPSQRAQETITVSGLIESQETAVISTRVMGFVSNVLVKRGDRVQQGQLLMTINSEDIKAKRAQTQAMVAEAEAAFKDAQADYDRYQDLHQKQSASTKELENVALRYNSIKAKLEAAMQQMNETDAVLAYANLTAPFSGVIAQKNIDVGSMASPGAPLLVVERPRAFQVSTFVTESEIGKLRKGMNVETTVKFNGRKFPGKILEISPSSQFTSGQFQIKVSIPAHESNDLFTGTHVKVSIALSDGSGDRTLYVPASAIVHRDQLSGIYTLGENNTAQLRWLKIGRESGSDLEVLSGLQANEKFISQSDGKLYNGVPVRVKQEVTKIDVP